MVKARFYFCPFWERRPIVLLINVSINDALCITINNVCDVIVGLILIIAPFAVSFKLWKGWSISIETKPADQPTYFKRKTQ